METHSPEWTYPEFRLLSEVCFYMVEAVGLEPTTIRLKAGYSSH